MGAERDGEVRRQREWGTWRAREGGRSQRERAREESDDWREMFQEMAERGCCVELSLDQCQPNEFISLLIEW